MAEKKILMVVPPRDFEGQGYEIARRVWEGRGYKVSVASLDRGTATAEDGSSVPVDVAIKDIKYYNYDAIVFIGGEGARLLFDDKDVQKLAKDAKYKTLGATGNAAVILALAGVLEGKKATAPIDTAGWLVEKGATFTGRLLEVDGKVLTLQEPLGAEHFANALVKALED